jgi:hypothetical protein
MWWKEANVLRESASTICRVSLFYLEDEGSKFLLGIFLPGYKVSHPRRQ